MNAFNWSSSPRATTDERKGTNKQLNLQKGRDFLGLRKVEIQPGSITIDPNPEASRAKQARLTKGSSI